MLISIIKKSPKSNLKKLSQAESFCYADGRRLFGYNERVKFLIVSTVFFAGLTVDSDTLTAIL